MREGKRHHIMSHKQEERHMMKEYKKSEDLAKAIKRGDYGRISTHTNREGRIELITDKGQKIEKAEKRREEMEKKKAPNYAAASVRAHEDDQFLARCVRQVVQQYENRIASGRPFPPQAEMTVKIELIVPYGNEPVEIIAEVPQFSATITGACFDRSANVIFTDTSGCIRMINQEGDALWETTMGYQSGFRPGNLLYLSTRILSHTKSSLCAVNILESDHSPVLYSISGSVQNVSGYGGSEFIVISGGKAMKSIAARKSVHRPEPKPRIEESETVDLDKAFSAARGFFSQIKRQVSKSKQPVFNKVKQVTESLSREIRREIFDDEIFINESTEKDEKAGQINEGEKERSKLNTPSPTPLDTDTLIIERKIKPQIKKKKKEKNDIPCIPPHESPVSQDAEKQLPIIGKSTTDINQREINAQEIAEAINKACFKVDEENSTESSTSSQSQFTIPIITSALSTSSLSTPKSSSPSNSWIIIDDEQPAAAESSSPSDYDEVINSCYDEI
ncbi:Oidioi.mRNA.OKI2018_I69.chr2.g6937.t1.cds [Oikopleura dioica]|uniref:Oidioi.mRNA.OKI2018_I69.chr2.g6937.t1.cds n=1 Tax=Oikopleura dioica TaxID=34765 RepID=A0ABN7T8C6_OIKDI|nr:Oidioi.mRNA.OKI2018_I69.chr2.g6937.t1.cds [Oikopleura dioica]